MPNLLDATGLQVKTYAELLAESTAAYQAIYGADINLDADTPDGQMQGIDIQATLDLEEILVQIYSGFDPDNAIGVTLDQRIAINGIERQAATYTVTPVTITVDRALTLYGLDQDTNDVYTVADNAGTQFQLVSTAAIGAPGANILSFRAVEPGRVLTTINTITVPVTTVLGVTGINNPSAATNTGVDEESDAAVKIRRRKSIAIAAQSYNDTATGVIGNIPDVSYVKIYENTSAVVDADLIPAHSIWVVIAGTPVEADLAEAIYVQRSEGAGMKGDEEYTITQNDGSLFIVRWDYVEPEDLYIEMDISSIDGVGAIDTAAIKAGLVANYIPDVYETLDITGLGTAVQAIDPNALVVSAGLSIAALGPFTDTLTPSAKNRQFVLSVPNIDITVV